MQDLSLNLIFFGAVAAGIGAAVFFALRFRLLLYYRMAAKKSLRLLRQAEAPFFYSSYAIKQEVFRKFFHLFVPDDVALAIFAIRNPVKGLAKVKRSLQKEPENFKLKLLMAELLRVTGEYDASRKLTEEIRLFFFVPTAYKAMYFHLMALNALYVTDMASASRYASLALKIFQKKGFRLEEAGCYLTLAQIYRISGVFDVAVTMLKEAEKIYGEYEIAAGLAEVKAYLGLNEMMRENYGPAAVYLNEAAMVAEQAKLSKTLADIRNWQGLCAYLVKDTDTARQYFSLSLKTASPAAYAFGAEMLARLEYTAGKNKAALKWVDAALETYRGRGNEGGVFEALYLKAEIYFKMKKVSEARRILTVLVQQKTAPDTVWYPANAYTLLGLVELHDKKPAVAKRMFQKAVDMEHARHRLKGAAIDYNNLAELCYRQGMPSEAEVYLKQAVSYAEMIGDKELQAYLKAKIHN